MLIASYLSLNAEIETPAMTSLPLATSVSEAEKLQVRSFCGDCHATPEPALFPKEAWHAEVVRGYRFYAEADRHDLDPPSPEIAVRYYISNAPAELKMPRLAQETPLSATSPFAVQPISLLSPLKEPPGSAHLKPGFQTGQIVMPDMNSGHIWLSDWNAGNMKVRSLGQLDYPCHVEWADLDGDGSDDLLVADLGGYFADDRQAGSISWMRRIGPEELGPPEKLLTGIGRACDVRVGDFNSDGLADLVAAEFGWLKTGGIHLLTQQESEGEKLMFERQLLDERAGAVHLLPFDADEDGTLDLFALFGQQFESIDLYRTEGGKLLSRQEQLYEAPDPGFGSSGFNQVDFDGDGDLDLLYTHGDTFDGPYVKPSHGVHWLENKGGLQYEPHRLLHLAGAYSAQAADFDRDGDLDVAVSAWLPSETRQYDRESTVSMLLLERTQGLEFKEHVLEVGNPVRASLLWIDIDQDGDLDIAASRESDDPKSPVLLDVWLNGRNASRDD